MKPVQKLVIRLFCLVALISGILIIASCASNAPSSSTTTATQTQPSTVVSKSNQESTSAPQQSGKKSEEPAKQTEAKPTPGKDGTVYCVAKDVDTFEKDFNSAADKAQFPYKINNLTVTAGKSQDSFSYMLNKNIGILGTVIQKDKSVRELMIVASGDGTPQSGANIVICMGTLIATVDKSLSPADRSSILKDCGFTNQNINSASYQGDTVRNGYKYTFAVSKSMGIMFNVCNANDK